jgi:hypothetical protein
MKRQKDRKIDRQIGERSKDESAMSSTSTYFRGKQKDSRTDRWKDKQTDRKKDG